MVHYRHQKLDIDLYTYLKESNTFFTFFLARLNGYSLCRISDDTRKKTIAFLWYLSLINYNNEIKKAIATLDRR